jgi:hypothetical protein
MQSLFPLLILEWNSLTFSWATPYIQSSTDTYGHHFAIGMSSNWIKKTLAFRKIV